MAAKIRAKITSANQTFQVLRLDRCPQCLLSGATAVQEWSSRVLSCEDCKTAFIDPNLEIHR